MTAPITDIPTQADATKAWLSKQAEPVTPPPPLETPTDLTGKTPVVGGAETPVVETPETPDAEVVEGGDTPAVESSPEAPAPEERFRKADGTFAKLVKGEFNGNAFELPEDVLVPQKRGEVVTMKPLSQVMAEGMRAEDYHAKRVEEAGVVREHKARTAAAEAKATVFEGVIKKLIADPNEAMRLADDPAFAKLWADSNELAVQTATRTASDRVAGDTLVQTTRAATEEHIRSMATEFPGVDARAVQEQYGRWLVSEGDKMPEGTVLTQAQADFYYHPDRIREFYQREHQRVQGSQKPLLDKIAAMEAKIAELEGKKAAAVEKKNDATKEALRRSGAPPVLGAQGGGGGMVGAGKSTTGEGGKPLSLTAASEAFRDKYRQ